MDEETLTALKESIIRWRSLLDATTPEGIVLRATECALCRVHVLAKGHCTECPVYHSVKMTGCNGTPYGRASAALHNWRYDRTAERQATFMKAVSEEVAFLESLLPEGEEMPPVVFHFTTADVSDSVKKEIKVFRELLTSIMDNAEFQTLSLLLKKIHLEHEDPRFLIAILRIVYYERSNISDWPAIRNSYKDAVCANSEITASMMFDMAFTGVDD